MRIVTSLVIMSVAMVLCGCGGLRFAPDESQKQNAWLHSRVTQMTAECAQEQGCSETLQELTRLSARQSGAFVAYFGLPADPLEVHDYGDVLGPEVAALADVAVSAASEPVDLWQMMDGVMELGLGLAAILGGVYGARAAGFIRETREKSNALGEIIRGNELFKNKNPQYCSAFKEAHSRQSAATRVIVAAAKE